MRSQATVMKKKYEEKIIELQEGSKAQEVQLTVTSNVFDEAYLYIYIYLVIIVLVYEIRSAK